MDEPTKANVLRFMVKTGAKRLIVRHKDEFYLCEVHEELTAWENQPYDELSVVPVPPPIEFV